MDGDSISSLRELVMTHNALVRSIGIFAALSGLSTQLPVVPLNRILSFMLLSMTIALWLELRSHLSRITSLETRFKLLVSPFDGELVRLVWFVIMFDLAAVVFVTLWLMADPVITGRLILIEVFLVSVPFVVSRIIDRTLGSRGGVVPVDRAAGYVRHRIIGSGLLVISLPAVVLACIYLPEIVASIRDGLHLQR